MKEIKDCLADSVYPLSYSKLKRIVYNINNLKGTRIILEDGTTTPVIKAAQFTSNKILLHFETPNKKKKMKDYLHKPKK